MRASSQHPRPAARCGRADVRPATPLGTPQGRRGRRRGAARREQIAHPHRPPPVRLAATPQPTHRAVLAVVYDRLLELAQRRTTRPAGRSHRARAWPCQHHRLALPVASPPCPRHRVDLEAPGLSVRPSHDDASIGSPTTLHDEEPPNSTADGNDLGPGNQDSNRGRQVDFSTTAGSREESSGPARPMARSVRLPACRSGRWGAAPHRVTQTQRSTKQTQQRTAPPAHTNPVPQTQPGSETTQQSHTHPNRQQPLTSGGPG